MKISLNELVLKENSGVYRIYNIFNGKSYIGSSKNLYKRLQEHYRALLKGVHHSIYFQRAWDRYGQLSFNVEILQYCNYLQNLKTEQYYLDLEKSYLRVNGYNMCPKAGNTLGYKTTQETKQKLKNSSTGAKNGFYGKKHTKQSLDKIRISRIGKENQINSKISATLMGRPNYSRMKKIECRSTLTGGHYIFNSITSAAMLLDIKFGSLASALNKNKSLLSKPYLTFNYYESKS